MGRTSWGVKSATFFFPSVCLQLSFRRFSLCRGRLFAPHLVRYMGFLRNGHSSECCWLKVISKPIPRSSNARQVASPVQRVLRILLLPYILPCLPFTSGVEAKPKTNAVVIDGLPDGGIWTVCGHLTRQDVKTPCMCRRFIWRCYKRASN